MRLLLTPMFVPCRHVEQYWYEVVKPILAAEGLGAQRPNINPLLEYMERTWIGMIFACR
jgi:hypothetical protein